MFITNDIKYIGVNDHQVDLFEGQYVVPNGMAYNSYAIALGVDRQFARRFGNRSLPECLWLKNAPHMNPQQCAAKMRQIANILDRARYAQV